MYLSKNYLQLAFSVIIVIPCILAKEKKTIPTAFVANCQACHMVGQAVVGPSLVEIAELYPAAKQAEFIKWCVEPGKKRKDMPQMPSMAHIATQDLKDIHQYILQASVGVKRIKRSNKDPLANTEAKTKRPRIQRTFVPESGPSSLILALPTEKKHNIIWDTDQCRLRYISIGEPDNWPYLKSNGNNLAQVGTIIYRENQLFKTLENKPQFKGYFVDEFSIPTFYYELNHNLISETINIEDNQYIIRVIKSEKALPKVHLVSDKDAKLKASTEITENQITIIYK